MATLENAELNKDIARRDIISLRKNQFIDYSERISFLEEELARIASEQAAVETLTAQRLERQKTLLQEQQNAEEIVIPEYQPSVSDPETSEQIVRYCACHNSKPTITFLYTD
jgi:hypothetical protein